MAENQYYPRPSDPNFQSKIYKKREFHYNRSSQRKKITNYEELDKYRTDVCKKKLTANPHQSFLSSYITPTTPYRGVLIFHGVGTGKTLSAISIAENFKQEIRRFQTKIYVLVSGPLIRDNWKNDIIKFYAKDYFKEIPYDKNNEESVKEAEKSVKLLINQYYRFMSYKTFYRKVLGERIVEKKMVDNKVQKIYRKNDEGEYERDVAVDRIESLDNTILIVDEAHNLTGVEHGLNNYGHAVKKIINKSKNLRVVLLSATPMKNFADDIIELINFIRHKDYPILREKVFTNAKSSEMGFKPDGLEYFKLMAQGYISYFRGADPFLFALKKEMGVIPPNLLFTPLVLCSMKNFQLNAYKEITKKFGADALEKNSGSVSNFAIPIVEDGKLIATYGNEGFNKLLRLLESNHTSVCNQINKNIFNGKYANPQQLIRLNSSKSTFTGDILLLDNLQHFSSKMYECLKNIMESFDGKRGASTGFVYANLRTVGIDIFDEILLTNGFLHYKENGEYDIKDNTIDYQYGLTYPEFRKKYNKEKFYPATFVKFTGADDEEEEDEPDEKINILKRVFNDVMNKQGKIIKLVLGTKVMNEGITLHNIKDVHILDTHYNLGRVIQVIGRAVRYCVHYELMTEKNPYPEVNVYKYVVNLPNQDSTEIVLYEKAEKKLMLIKKLERVMKEIAIDCPINYQANVFIEEQEKSKKCQSPLELKDKKIKTNMCSDLCDFMPCKYTCGDPKLSNLYDPSSLIYKRLEKEKLDYSTFLLKYANNEIEYAKNKIKELYKLKYVYTLSTITDYVKKSLNPDQSELFDDYFIYQALAQLLPVSDDEFNSFSDVIYDRYNVPGYLIYRNVYYIFQPLDQKDDVPLFYRTVYQRDLINDLSMSNYLKLFTLPQEEEVILEKSNFDTTYYESKKENSIVGIIDIRDNNEVFKIRRSMTDEDKNKKRGEGIISIKGSTCEDKEKSEILLYSKKLDVIGINKDDSRQKICSEIKNRLIELEKYNKDDITYLIIPNNHPTLEFPLNIHDRKDHIVKEVEAMNLKINVESSKNKYILTVKSDNEKLRSFGFSKENNIFIKVID
jgi:superfamily II DNA or RNA helicase